MMTSIATNVTKKHPLRVWTYLNDRTLTDLATDLGVSQGIVSLWMHGRRRIPVTTAVRIEEITGGAVVLGDWAWMYIEADGTEIRKDGAGRDQPRAEPVR